MPVINFEFSCLPDELDDKGFYADLVANTVGFRLEIEKKQPTV
jgi:hypothetical protein